MKRRILSVLIIAMILNHILSISVFADNSNKCSWKYTPSNILMPGDDITVFADGLEGTCDLILALYKDDRLVDVSYKECEATEKSVSITVPDDFSEENEWLVKVFAWDSLPSMIPLVNSLEVKLESDSDITDRFEDSKFLQEIRTITGKNEDEPIYKSDVRNITELNLEDKEIQSLAGIEYLTELQILNCVENKLTELDVSENTKLKELYCWFNDCQTLDFSNNKELEILDCGYNPFLAELNVSGCIKLKELYCEYDSLTSLKPLDCVNLMCLVCYRNELEELDVSDNINLEELNAWENKMTKLDVSNNTKLTYLDCEGNYLTTLDISNNTKLTDVDCGYNKLTKLDVSNNTKLTYLYCKGNEMNSTDDVTGWQEIGLVLGDNFIFSPQNGD